MHRPVLGTPDPDTRGRVAETVGVGCVTGDIYRTAVSVRYPGESGITPDIPCMSFTRVLVNAREANCNGMLPY